METSCAVDAVLVKLQEDFVKNIDALHVAHLENIATKDALKKIKLALRMANVKTTELQVDYNTISGILDHTKDVLMDMESDFHAAQKKIEDLKSDLMWEKFFNALEAEDTKKEVADARQEATDARQEAVEARKSSTNIRRKRTMGTRTTPVVTKRISKSRN
jgi:predicted  nucleic acid-binding Zn-ribbon protein